MKQWLRLCEKQEMEGTTMADRHTNLLPFTLKTNDVRWEVVNVLLNAAVQIIACTVPTAGH
jgi:hypothetical protein